MTHVPPPNKEIADLVELLGEENVRLLIRTFLRECPALIRQIETGDRTTRHRLVHSLKSNARVVGALDLSARMLELEARLATETGPDLTAEEVARIAADFDRAAAPLRTFVGET
jgi:HPt (histidine-containing phosphotransfer) domain-containing protein